MNTDGTDFDGTLTSDGFINFNNTKLPWFCGLCLIFVRPNKKMIAVLRSWQARGDRIIIISARPKQLEGLTKWWLERNRIPFDQLLLVGKGKGVAERKLEIIQKEKIGLFFDDDPKTVKFLQENGINARFP